MKKFALSFLLTIAVGGLYGCANQTVKPGQRPLETEQPVGPPPGCVEFRKRGGAC